MFDDEKLLIQASSDPEAFARFYRLHAAAVLTYLRARTADIEVASDLTADVFAAAWGARERFNPELGPPRAWLFGIANNRLSNERRKRRRASAARRRLGIPALAIDEEGYAEAERAIDAALTNGLVSLVEDLPADQRAAVRARIIDERAYADIAADTGTTEAVIRQRVSRGLSRLATTLRRQEA